MWEKLIKITRDYFYISHSEARGTLVLVILILAVILGTFIYRNYGNEEDVLSTITITELDSLIKKKEAVDEHFERFSFDPNTETDFEALGVPKFLANRIINYRKAGGQFRVKTDLAKIYGFPDSLYQQLEDFINLPETAIQQKKKTEFKKEKSFYPPNKDYPSSTPKIRPLNLTFDLSTVDSLDLQLLPGIGKVFASRIIKYRDRLGGFYDVKQLYEVYGIPKETVEVLIKNTASISDEVLQLDLNKATFKELLKHPYLEYEDVQNIFNFKFKYGGFNQVEDLQKHQVVSDSVFVKVAPYLKI